MKYIQTGRTRSDAKRKVNVLVDDSDYAYLSQFNWQVDKFDTVQRHTKFSNGVKGHILIHRDILKPNKNQEVDHIDGNRLNNQRSNLRFATSSQNKINRGARKDNQSGYKGVSWHKQRDKWTARIMANGKYQHLGLFENILDAVTAYNEAALKYQGSFAWTNSV